MHEPHLLFPFDAMSDEPLWRYMDFTKLVSMLESRSLYFARLDQLEDEFEGHYPPNSIESYRGLFVEAAKKHDWTDAQLEEAARLQMSVMSKAARHTIFANCWHQNDYESAAMWRLYLKSDEGIAVRTTARNLVKSLQNADKTVRITKVKYIDYHVDMIDASNALLPAAFKRRSFEHEKEVRLFHYQSVGPFHDSDELESLVAAQPTGIAVPVDLDDLVQEVFVAPKSPPWIFHLVGSVARKYGLRAKVLQSSLSASPIT
jgi:hypothetical protein